MVWGLGFWYVVVTEGAMVQVSDRVAISRSLGERDVLGQNNRCKVYGAGSKHI